MLCCSASSTAASAPVEQQNDAPQEGDAKGDDTKGFSVKKGRKEGRYVVTTDGSGSSKVCSYADIPVITPDRQVTASGHTVTEDFNGARAVLVTPCS